MFRAIAILSALAFQLATAQECRMRLDEAAIDLHGWLRAFYSCNALGRSFVMDHNVQRPLPSYANFSYGRSNYSAVLKEVLQPLGLRLVQGKWMDAVVVIPPREREAAPAAPAATLAVAQGHGGVAPDSARVDSADYPAALDTAKAPRKLRAKASGILRSSAKRMGLEWSELLASSGPNPNSLSWLGPGKGWKGGNGEGVLRASQLWHVSARASDSLGSIDFARVVDFVSYDTARVVFGGETRRPDAVLNYENGAALTQYSSVFDGLTVDVRGERWAFVWRGSGSVLEVPGIVGGCASGSSKVAFEGRAGVPFLGKIPVLNYLFSWENKYDDELLVSVCLEEVSDA